MPGTLRRQSTYARRNALRFLKCISDIAYMKFIQGRNWRVFSRETVWGICTGLLIGIGIFAVATAGPEKTQFLQNPSLNAMFAPAASRTQRLVDLDGENASNDVRYIVDWIADSRDSVGLPFVIVDKKDAKVYVFDKDAQLHGASPILLGSAKGDDSVSGIGSRPVDQVAPEERTTPAGRFVGERGHNLRGEDVVWVDYDAAVSIHRVLTTHPEERRLERLASPAIDDKRISLGCINVPTAFYETYIRPTFAKDRAIVYVLPEIKSINQVFDTSRVSAMNRYW